ncbi:MAG: radical SAM protein [Pirellulales bacterium]|nr:radical SAM protein [Pirellulales bacterium]
MLTLVNTNRMTPPIAPIGLDYLACAARRQGETVDMLDLCLVDDPACSLREYFAHSQPELVGLSFRNIDDCFWPGAAWFLPDLAGTVGLVRALTDAPIVLGGVGYSIFPEEVLVQSGADFGIRGDGETALVALVAELRAERRWDRVPGLVWPSGTAIHANAASWPSSLAVPAARDAIDNPTYFRRGGQVGLETKRGCPRQCIYCADPLAKGNVARLRSPADVADEAEALLAQGVDVLHLCDSEFNIPAGHAHAVCDELIGRRLGDRVRWYAYLAVVPFDDGLASRMRRAGCAGINFTSDAASPAMLRTYRQPHRREEIAKVVHLCRRHGIAVMLDLLFGGPGETPETVAESIRFFQQTDPNCAGAALGIRLYPGTEAARLAETDGPLDRNPGIHRRYEGPIDLVRPTFYVSPALGDHPARLVRELIGGDPRFFEPASDVPQPAAADYNYNENQRLVNAIAQGARGAYWDILRRMQPG